jgi:hypothetical protein
MISAYPSYIAIYTDKSLFDELMGCTFAAVICLDCVHSQQNCVQYTKCFFMSVFKPGDTSWLAQIQLLPHRVFLLTHLTTWSELKLFANSLTSMRGTTVLCYVGCQAMLASPAMRPLDAVAKEAATHGAHTWWNFSNQHLHLALPWYILFMARWIDKHPGQ